MLAARIYRTGLIVVALALVVLAFSLRDQQGALSPTLAPDVFNGQNVSATMSSIAAADPSRRPGSDGDKALAAQVGLDLRSHGFAVSTDTFSGRTVDGTRTLENVVGIRPGRTSGSIVIVAHRDALGSPALAALSGTATLIELARDLEGETLSRTVVLASTTASQGTAGAIRLARRLGGPVDAVVVLGDLASAHIRQPILVPWTTRQVVAPPLLRNTVAAALQDQASLTVSGTGIGGQFARLALPFTLSEQAPFGASGMPSLTLTLSGEQGPGSDAPLASVTQLTGIGRAVLQTISALDSGATVPAPSAYLLLDGKVVPVWAISLFALALMVPVMMTTIDALARARRRGYSVWRSLGLVIAAAIPFLLAALVVLAARLLGVIAAAPPAPVAPGAVPLHGGGVAVMVVAALVAIGSALGIVWLARRVPLAAPPSRRGASPNSPGNGAVAALPLVLCAVTFVIWLGNPFAALLLIPALHLWLWGVSPDLRVPAAVRIGLIAAGLVPVALVVLYYANRFGYGPVDVIWQAMLLVAGHGVGPLAVLESSVVLGCVASAAVLAVLAVCRPRPAPVTVTVRGPVTYAGPGSLGGTKSTLRR